jgi:uncharacterized protein (TIGR02466 family)
MSNSIETFDIFPFPISVYDNPDHQNIKQKVFEIIEQTNETVNVQSKDLFHYGNDIGESVLYNEIFSKFKKWVEDCCVDYVTNILGFRVPDTMVVTDSWINKTKVGGYQYYHYHCNSFVSGTYYVNFNKSHVPLFFKHPSTLSHNFQPVIELEKLITTKYNSDAQMEINEGSLFLWQSNLQHGYPVNPYDDRISISMNFIPSYITSGKYGFKTTVENLLQVQD